MLLTTNLDGRFELKEDGLLHKYFSRGLAQQRNILLLDCYAFAVTIYQLVD